MRLAGCFLAALVLTLPARAQLPQEAQALVDQATVSLPQIFNEVDPGPREQLLELMREARGVLLCPGIIRAGFIFGGRGGGCVLLGREGGGWSHPAFYVLGGAGFGLQAGVQEMTLMMVVRTEQGLSALMDSQFTIGGDIGVSVATLGANLQGATTSALGADIVAVARARGLFMGLSIEGSLISARSQWNMAYYGDDLSGRQVVLQGQGRNPGADALRAELGRFSERFSGR